MHFEFLVEEQSAETLLLGLLPKILRDKATYRIHPFQGKQDMLSNLHNRLLGYKNFMTPDMKIIVLIDRDKEDCITLKQKLEAICLKAGLTSKSSAKLPFQVINREIIEELEAWFFGDMEAVRAVYPKVPANVHNKAPYRDPDMIKGGTWEAFLRVLQKSGYHLGGLRKIEAAREISQHMVPIRNTSKSFQVFYRTLTDLIA